MLGELPVGRTLRSLRRAAGAARRQLFPTAEEAAWRAACRVAEVTPRYLTGEIDLCEYHIEYADLMTLCPQWHDIFVERVLAFRASRENPRILDCGANVGLASLFFKQTYPAASVTAYEADPDLVDICRRNMGANGAGDVMVRQAAIWTMDGTLPFRCEGADGGAIEALGTSVPGALRSVPSLRLRDVLAVEPRVDLLKMDIEGAEFEVLRDCAEELTRVDALLIDVHEFDPGRRRVPELLQLLTTSRFTYALDHLMLLPWRGETSSINPFPKTATSWAALVRAWRS
jgi:FkbM family methyltransferase